MEELISLCEETVLNVFKMENKANLEVAQFALKIEAFCKDYAKDTATSKSRMRGKRLAPIRDVEDALDASDEESARESFSSSVSSTTSAAVSPVATNNLRPVRTARSKVVYTEQSMRTKLRQPDVNIKQERVSKVSSPVRESIVEKNDRNIENDKNSSNKRKSKDEGFVSNQPSINELEENESKKLDNSLEIIPQEEVKMEILSDDDTEKMPPPKMPVIKAPRKPRTKKAAAVAATTASAPIEEPKRTSKRTEKAAATQETSVGSEESSKSQKKSTNSIATNADTVIEFFPVKVKIEKLSLPKSVPEETVAGKKTRTKPGPKSKKAVAAAPSSPEKSEKSFYEDAMSEGKQYTNENEVNNATFCTDAPDSTFTVNNDTFTCVQEEKSAQKPTNGEKYRESIMTEDNSIDEELNTKENEVVEDVPVEKTDDSVRLKKKKEIFNPYVNSPVMKKVEAFEKHAVSATFSPAMKTRTRAAQGTTPSHVPRAIVKSATPSTKKVGTPLQVNLIKTHSSSTSKLPQGTKKPASADNLRRELSLDDLTALKKATNTAALEEKRKKREEKQRVAQQQREQMDKEKREQAEKVLREREEKYRKKMQEKEDKLRLEKEEKFRQEVARKEIQRLKKEAEQKRIMDEYNRTEGERIAREHAEIMKMNILKENQQQKLQMQMHQQRLMQQQHQIKSKTPVSPVYTFEMLETDDETDDESKPNPKRPQIPSWSRKHERFETIIAQSKVNSKVIDAFFSVAPMTPDLAEIFPKIDQRKLKRNSSAVWRTPPRYSQMPKY